MSRCEPWHYRGKKNRWRECREMHMSAEDRTWMLEHAAEPSWPEMIRQHHQACQQAAAQRIKDFVRWVDAYEAPRFPLTPAPQWVYQRQEREGGGSVVDFTHLAPKQPEQYGISDETNERARRLIESALGDDHA
jgi:hypothetical protein